MTNMTNEMQESEQVQMKIEEKLERTEDVRQTMPLGGNEGQREGPLHPLSDGPYWTPEVCKFRKYG